MPEVRVVYDDFTGGEFGHLGSAKAPANSYTGRNIMLYRNGMLGPRPGIKLSPVITAVGTIANIWWSNGASNTDIWWVTTTGNLFKASLTTGTITAIGTCVAPGAVVPQAAYMGLGKWLMTIKADKTYVVNVSAATTTAITDSKGGSDITIYGDRAFIANDGTDFFRVWYSAAADLDSWDFVNDYFDTKNVSGVSGLYPQKDHLSILHGDGSWSVFRGGDPATGVQRKITATLSAAWGVNAHAATVLSDDTILYMSTAGDYPTTFDGASIKNHYGAGPQGDVDPYTSLGGIRALPNRRPGESLLVRPSAAEGRLIYIGRDGTFSLGITTAAISALACSSALGLFVFTNPTGPTVWCLDLRLDRPGFVSDTLARPGDLTDTPLDAYFHMPEWWSPPGTSTRVMQVIVDFVKYQTGATGDDCGFNLSVTSFGQFENDGTESPVGQTYTESGAAATTTGVRDRKTFNVGEQGYGAGFQVGLTGIKGVAVKTITVVLDTQPSLPRL